jgi:tetratricopeptide (TPR) repeat protein
MTDYGSIGAEAEALHKAAAGAAAPHAPTESEKASKAMLDDAIAPANPSMLSEVTTAAGNQGKTVWNGVAQLADRFGADMPMAKLQTQTQAATLSPRWWLQQGGSLAVTVPLIVLTHRGISAVTEPFAAGASRAAAADVAAKAFASGPDKLALARLALTGATYEGIFKPTTDKNIALGRFKQAGEGGLGFFAMGYTAGKVSSAMSLGATAGEGGAGLGSKALKVLLPGMAGGGAYGLVHEQSKSFLDTLKPAGFYKTVNATASALMGTLLSSVGMLKADAAPLGKAQESGSSTEIARTVESIRASDGGKTAVTNLSNDVLAGLKQDADMTPTARFETVNKANGELTAAKNFARNGQHQEAVDQYMNALKGLARARGIEHPTLADVLSGMARSDMYLGNSARSIESLQSALRINKSAFGEGSSEVANNFDQLSAVYVRAGDYSQGAQALENSVNANRAAAEDGKLSGPARQDFEANQHDLLSRVADLYDQGGDKARAEAVRQSMPPKPTPAPEPH